MANERPNVRVLETRPQQVHASVIERLESALAEARAGQISSIAIAVVRPHGGINCCRSETDDVGSLLGAISLAQHRMLMAME